MNRTAPCLLFLALTLALPAAAEARFVFKVPAGWTDLSPGAPPENFKRAPPELVEMLRTSGMPFYAADLDGAGDGFMENVNASVNPSASPITAEVLGSIVDSIGAEAAKQGFAPGEYRVLERSIVQIGGVPCGRYVAEMHHGPMNVKQIGYVLPSRERTAVVTYSAAPEDFARYQPIFDAAAAQTGGIEEPPGRLARILGAGFSGGLYGGIGGLLIALVAALRVRRRKVHPTPSAPPPTGITGP